MFYWLLKGILLGPLLRAVFRPWLSGEENVPVECCRSMISGVMVSRITRRTVCRNSSTSAGRENSTIAPV